MDSAVLGSPQGSDHDIKRFRTAGPASSRAKGQAHPRRIRLGAQLLVMLLIAALCPLVPFSNASADEGPTIEILPAKFTPLRINNKGEVAGVDYTANPPVPAIYRDGEVITLGGGALGSYRDVIDFNDRGELLIRFYENSAYVLKVVSESGVRVLERPTVGNEQKHVYAGYGPSKDGTVVGVIPWNRDFKTNGVTYRGATPPELITKLSTVMEFNDAGTIFGMLPGSVMKYGMLQGETLTEINGLPAGSITTLDLSDEGHLLFRGSTGQGVWHDGEVKAIPWADGTATAINSEGVTSMIVTGATQNKAAIRFPNGRVQTLEYLFAGMPNGWKSMVNVTDINDQCDVLGLGETSGPRSQARSFVAHLKRCNPVSFEGSFFRTDLAPPTISKDEETAVRLSLKNVSGDDLSNVKLTSVEVVETDLGGEAEIVQDGDGPPQLMPKSGPGSEATVDFKVTGKKAGKVFLRANLTAIKDGEAVSEKIDTLFSIRAEDLLINLTLDPPDYEVPEDGVFEPIDITATVSFTNQTDEEMTNIRLQDLDVKRVFSGQELHVTYKSGIRPDPLDPEVIVESLAPGATSAEFQAIFTATDTGQVDFTALATAKVGEKGAATGSKKVRWKPKVKKYVEIKTTVTNPADGTLLEAGSPVIIDGTVENLSNDHRLTLGPLLPQLEGNTGTMNVAYNGPAPNPSYPVPAEPLVLEPGEKKTFQVRFTTNYSDPAMYGAHASGGTRAYATFEPWGEAVEVQDPNATEEPEVVQIRTYDEAKPGNGSAPGEEPDAQVKATSGDLFKRISIDDSIELPSHPPAAVAAGYMVGAVEGLANAAIATIYSIPDIVTMPYSILVAAYDYQAKVWESFTEEEKELFLTETSFLIVSVLMRNVEFGLRDAGELYDQVYQMAGEHLTQTENNWHTGDFMATSRGYAAFLSEQIGSVAGPIILSKMAQSPKAIAALERFQTAVNARMAATFQAAKNIKYVDNVLPILQSIENGAEPTLTAIAKLWGITPDEIAEYQRICAVIGCIATVRSRHASSVEWIQKFGALLKPENLKIKTVNELDVMLGYDIKDLGSLVFRKPEVLKTVGPDASKAEITAEIKRFAASKGFRPDSSQYNEAVKRIEDRVSEWNKYEKTYKQWNDRGWIDTSLNYEGNAIPAYRYDANGEIIGTLTGGEKGSYRGFRLAETSPGSEEYVVQMLDGKTGRWRRITGDIDPVDFTYTDGSPLSPEDLAKLMKMLQDSPIGAQHGYTSTFLGFKDPKTGAVIVNPGPELVKKQFKPNEAALQIAPGANPRATRLDVANSRWVSPQDYNMRWVNGFVDASGGRRKGTTPVMDANFEVIKSDAPKQIALPVRSKPADPTVGRFIIKHANEGETGALIMGTNGQLQTVNPDGTTEDSPLHSEAFSEGPMRTITVAPASTLLDNTDPQAPKPNPVRGGGGKALVTSGVGRAIHRLGLMAAGTVTSLSAGSNAIRVSVAQGLAGGASGFAAGQTIAIGTGDNDPELRKIATVDEGIITLTAPLERDHQAGEVVQMVVSASGVPVNPNKGLDPVTEGSSGSNTEHNSGTNSGSTSNPRSATAVKDSTVNAKGSVAAANANNTSQPKGRLPFTGTNSRQLLLLALALLAVGFTAIQVPSLRRRLGWHRSTHGMGGSS